MSTQPLSPTGNVKNLVILAAWGDHRDRTLPPADDLRRVLNGPADLPGRVAPGGGVRDYLLAQSGGRLTVDSDVYGWFQCETLERDNVVDLLIYEALNQLEERGVDLRPLDQDGDGYINVTCLHSGYDASYRGYDVYGKYYRDRIWAHVGRWLEWQSKRSGVRVKDFAIISALHGVGGGYPVRQGVVAHEWGHLLLNLEDQYLVGSTHPNPCLMRGTSGYYPAALCGVCRQELGWTKIPGPAPVPPPPAPVPVPALPDYNADPNVRRAVILLREMYLSSTFPPIDAIAAALAPFSTVRI